MPCTVCIHENRMVIDRLIGAGTASERSLAEQFGLSATAVHRHKEHVVATVRRTIQRREVERGEQIASKWVERLESAYGLAEAGTRAAAQDEKNWPAGARFLGVMAKLIETGLEVDGAIGPNASATVTTTVEQVLVLPRARPSPAISTTCEPMDDES